MLLIDRTAVVQVNDTAENIDNECGCFFPAIALGFQHEINIGLRSNELPLSSFR